MGGGGGGGGECPETYNPDNFLTDLNMLFWHLKIAISRSSQCHPLCGVVHIKYPIAANRKE